MIEIALVQQLATRLAPALPYLMAPIAVAAQKTAEAVNKLGEDNWKIAQQIWGKLWPWVDKKPEIAEALKEVAKDPDDEIAKSALPRDLKKLLESMPLETVNEIRDIVSQNVIESTQIKADHGSMAAGSNISHSTIINK